MDEQGTRLYESARDVLAGGVSASMRMHPYLGRPFYLSRGEGAYVFDTAGRRYIDFNGSNGAALLGHHHPAVTAAVQRGLELGTIAAAETEYHQELATMISEVVPVAERVRFASTGSEVTLVAVPPSVAPIVKVLPSSAAGAPGVRVWLTAPPVKPIELKAALLELVTVRSEAVPVCSVIAPPATAEPEPPDKASILPSRVLTLSVTLI